MGRAYRIGEYVHGLILLGLLVYLAVDVGFFEAAIVAGTFFLSHLALHYRDELRKQVIPLAIGVGAVGFIVTGDAKANLKFYEIAAQVVPALFIALAVNLAIFLRQQRGEARRPAFLVTLALFLAEYECLRAVAANDRDEATFALVVGALFAAGVGLTLPVVLGPPDEPSEHPDEQASKPSATIDQDGRVSPSWAGLFALVLLLFAGRGRE